MNGKITVILVLIGLLLLGCGSSGGSNNNITGSTGLDVTGTWKGTISEGGSTSTWNLTLPQSGSNITGTNNWSSTGGTSGSNPLTGSISGTSISLQETDASCGSRVSSGNGTVSGNSMTLTYTAPAGGSCPAGTVTITFAKQ